VDPLIEQPSIKKMPVARIPLQFAENNAKFDVADNLRGGCV